MVKILLYIGEGMSKKKKTEECREKRRVDAE